MLRVKKGKDSFYARYTKRCLDVLLSSLAIIVLSPILIVVGILIRIKLGTPILFVQQRIGKDEKPFCLYKFRSMTEERDENGIYLPDSERITAFGRFIRKTSIDELPNLVNILCGEMSIIGPRPLPKRYLSRYTLEQLRRHEVRPGLSSPGVVHGRNMNAWNDQFAMDVWYVDHISFEVDTKCVLETIGAVIRQEGATSEDGDSRSEFVGTADIENLQDQDGNYIKLH